MIADARTVRFRTKITSHSYFMEQARSGDVTTIKRVATMADGPDKPPSAPDRLSLVQRLVKEANITEEQARELIALLGYWASLIREARFLTRKR
ncbi:MAG: hypothetical protein E5X43_38445 [Mesorhizobium sp.]|nr:MAG: hypothetical protein E5X43_38445 [Mesorhizobium sp.]